MADLHEPRQERKKRSPFVTKVRHGHKTLLGLWSTLPSLQVMGRLTFWETWPGGLKGGLGGDDRGSRKDGQKPSRKALYVDGDTSSSNEEQPDEVDVKGAETLATSDAGNEDKPENCSSDERGMVGENRVDKELERIYDIEVRKVDIMGQFCYAYGNSRFKNTFTEFCRIPRGCEEGVSGAMSIWRPSMCEVREHCMKGDVMRMRLPMGNVEGRLTTVLMKTKSEKGGGRTPRKMRNHLSLSKS